MKLTETTLIGNFIQEARVKSMNITLTDAIEIIQTTIAATSDYLSQVKSKDEKTALVFEDIKGNMIAAGIVEYVEGEDGNPGSWAYYYSFDEKDIEDAKKFSIYSSGPKQIYTNRAFDDYRMKFTSPDFIAQLVTIFMEVFVDFLDQNANENNKFSVEHEGFFVATVEVVDGEKVMNLIPDGAMKRLIKDDDLASADVK